MAADDPALPENDLPISLGTDDQSIGSSKTNSNQPIWPILLALGSIATLVAFGFGELAFGFFTPPTRAVSAMGVTMNLPTPDNQIASDTKNETFAFGLIGSATGLCLGVAGGWVRKSTRWSVTAGVVGLILGGAIGYGSCFGAIGFYNPHREAEGHTLLPVMLLHLLIFGSIGAVSGLSFGLGCGRAGAWHQAMVGGLIGAMFGAVLAEMVGAVVFPNDKTDLPVSVTMASRLLYRVIIGITMTIGLGLAMSDRTKTK